MMKSVNEDGDVKKKLSGNDEMAAAKMAMSSVKWSENDGARSNNE